MHREQPGGTFARALAAARASSLPEAQVRKFKAARPGRLVGGFSIFPTSPRQEVREDLRGLIQHARHAAQNVDYLKSYEMMVRRHVVGKRGITLAMMARNPDGKLDRIGNKLIEDAWEKWGLRGNCTTCGRLSWWQVEKTAATMLAREGNFLLRVWRGSEFGPFGFQIQPVSIDLLDLTLTQSLGNGGHIDGGVEFNTLGRVVAFHMWQGHPAEAHTGGQGTRLRIPAADMIHVYRPDETGQVLGVPSSHTALRRFNMLGQYEEAALKAAHYGAANMAFLTQPEEDGPGGGGDEGEIPEEIEAGSIATLPGGWGVAQWSPNYPDGEMPAFNKSMIRGGAAGLGVSYAGLSSDMEGANYSSLRDGRGEERDEWRMFQRDLSESLHGEVFKAWLRPAMISGQVPLPLSKVDKFLAATWRPRGWQSVNPKDDATANEKDMSNFLRAPSDIVAERGEDFEDVVGRVAGDMEILKAAGLSMLPAAFKLAGPSDPPPEPFDPLNT